MKFKWIVLLLLLSLMMVPVSGCNCEKEMPAPAAQTVSGFTNPEDLARVYLKAIEDKDMEALKTLFVAQEDLHRMNLKKATKQHWMGYFTHNKRLFLNKNKDLLGRRLTFLSFRPGTEYKVNPDISIYRAAQILAEQADNKRVTLELNFIIRLKGTWKILFLRYLNPKANLGQGPKLQKGDVKPKMKIPGPEPKMEIKVKKVEPQPDGQAPPPGDAEDSLEELKKLFGEN